MIPVNIGGAINTIGDVFDLVGSMQDQKAMADQLANEIRVQGLYTQAGNQAWAEGLGGLGADTAETQIGKGQAERIQGYNSLYGAPLSTQPMLGNERDVSHAHTIGAMRARLGGYGDWQHGVGMEQQATSNKLGQIGFQSQGWAQNVYPYQMAAAQHAGDVWNTIATGIKMVGQGFGGGDAQVPGAENPSIFRSPTYDSNWNWYMSGGGPNYQMPPAEEYQNIIGNS